jgi:hypothetical protein
VTDTTSATPIRLGLRENLGQFALLVGVNALVGGMIGQERTVLPLLADRVFGLTAYTAALTFILAFGATKAATNFFAGTLSDRHGRKPVLVAGWLIALPIPFLLMWAPTWGWVIVANVLLGVNQGLTWSTTVIMKIDLVGPSRRGFAMGLNEAAGYGAVAITAPMAALRIRNDRRSMFNGSNGVSGNDRSRSSSRLDPFILPSRLFDHRRRLLIPLSELPHGAVPLHAALDLYQASGAGVRVCVVARSYFGSGLPNLARFRHADRIERCPIA